MGLNSEHCGLDIAVDVMCVACTYNNYVHSSATLIAVLDITITVFLSAKHLTLKILHSFAAL